MAKLLSGTRIYGNLTVDTFIAANDIAVSNNVTVNNLTVYGDLAVQGNTVTLNTATLTVEDKNILLANGAGSASAADGAGITIDGSGANIIYRSTGDKFVTNKPLDVTGNLSVSNAAFLNGDPVITLNPLNQSLAILRAQVTAPVGNVLYVAGNGNDSNDGYSFANALANIHTALDRAQPWTTVFVKSGDYILYNQPVTIKQRVGMVGDNLRTTTIRPHQANVDMFYVNNASYVTGITFRDHISPAAVFSFNPNKSAGFITTSPYIQNCSSITTTGTGMRVDGNYVTGLRSMVCDSYTQTNAGGIGIHMLNKGYTQLVSVFTICCQVAILCEAGGFCSITNSNSSFGTYGLSADGVSEPGNFGTTFEQSTGANQFELRNLASKPNYGDAVLFANYDRTKCLRDAKLIVDSLAIDLAYGGNTQSTFAGLQYWAQATSAIPNQATETIAAFTYAKNLATNVAQNITITAPRQANVTQVSGTAGGWVTRISDGFDLVANIITGGTVGVTDRIVPNSFPANTDVSINNSANLVLANKEFIKKEVIAYVRQEYPGFFDNANNFIDPANAATKCERDTGYLLDSITFDLLHGGNRQAIQSGVYYYQFSSNDTQINDQVVQTGRAYDYIGSIIDEVVTNVAVSKLYQTNAIQNTAVTSAATLAEANSVMQNIAIIKNIISTGANVAPAKQSIQFTPSANTNIINAAKTILANKDFIAAEVVGYVNQNWANISNGAATFYTVASATALVANASIITLLETVPDTILEGITVSFHQRSYISASGHTFEYIGSGNELATALPYAGGVPIQANEVRQTRGGAVYFTSTDQQGDFRIGTDFVVNRVDGTITGRTFNKSLFATMTPYILAIEG